MKQQITRAQFDKNWTWGAEPIATIPGEPMEFYKADEYLENAEAALFDTEKGEYYIKRANGTYVYNPKTRSALFKTAKEARTEYFNTLNRPAIPKGN